MSFAPFNSHSSSDFHDYNILKCCDIINIEPVLSLTIVLIVTLCQYLQKDLNLCRNLILTTLDHPVKANFLFQAVILQDLEENQ